MTLAEYNKVVNYTNISIAFKQVYLQDVTFAYLSSHPRAILTL